MSAESPRQPAPISRHTSRRSPHRTVGTVARYVLLTAIAVIFVGPFLLLLSAALKPATQTVFSFPPDLIPRPPVLDWFAEAWTTIPYLRFILNSLLYEVLILPVYLIVSLMTAYPLARIAFRGRTFFFVLFLSTMFLPGELMLIPRFLVMGEMGLANTIWAVVLPAILSSLGIFLLRQAFLGIPSEVFEAARIDGANEWQIFTRVAIPLTMPTIAVLTILGFISVWNSFIWPLVVLNDQSIYPLALGIAYLSGVSGTDVRGLAAGTVMSLIPVVVVFIALQRHILSSMSGAVKG